MRFRWFFNKKKLHKEYIQTKQQLRRKQSEATNVFEKVKANPNRNTGDDPELHKANNEANELAKKLIQLKRDLGIE